MNKISRLSAVVAVLAATATFASADTFLTIGSYVAPTTGFNNSAISSSTTVSATDPGGSISMPSGSAVAISPNTAWTAAGSVGTSQSQWISFEAGTGAGPTVVADNGYYSYYTTFTASSVSTGSISVLADDTTAVYLNGHLMAPVANPADGNSTCEVDQPNCRIALDVPLSDFITGTNVLVFSVQQTNASSTGLDFYGTVDVPVVATNASVPEPSTLLLLGTGLIGSAGALFRRMRS